MAVKYTLRYTAIQAKDLDRSLRFYVDIIGMRLLRRIKVPETKGEFGILKTEGTDHWLEINWYPDQEYRSGDELDHIAFEVENLDEALSDLKSKGHMPVSYIRETERSKWTYINDPDGIWIEIFQRKQ